jgi:YgiT-type zinc finger domain-containing protein
MEEKLICFDVRYAEQQKRDRALVDEVFVINGKHVLVEGIPANVCARCGEATFSRETTERIRRMVHGEAQPVRVAAMDVFAYAKDRA